MQKQTASVRVPATVGNLGGAGDTAALALEASLNVKVTRRADGHVGIRYFGEHGERVPRDRSNLVVRAIEAALHWKEREFTGADIEIYSSIPVAVGLGSSTAAVLAGLLAADALYRLDMGEKGLLDLASVYETRGTNLQAAWLGGFVVSVENASAVNQRPAAAAYQKSAVPDGSVLSVVVPEIPRSAKVPALDEALQVRLSGDVPVFVCGSGPAVGVFAARDSEEAVREIGDAFARHGVACSSAEFRPSNTGALEWNALNASAMVAMSPALSKSLSTASPAPA